MEVTRYDAPDFATAVQPVIERHPAQSSVLATVLDQVLHGVLHAAGHPEAFWLLLTEAGKPVAAAMQTPPFNLFLTPLPEADQETAAGKLAETLLAAGQQLPGVTGQVSDADAFARTWSALTGCRRNVAMIERLYELRDLPAEPAASGAARLATESDVELAADWMTAFMLEALPHREVLDAEQAVRNRLNRGWYLLWEDGGEPVSLAGLHPAAAGVSRIGPVYTPAFRRRHGYGSAVTAAASRLGFEQGAQACVLYADLTNPTSNGIYQEIGYRPVGDSAEIAFGSAATP